MILHCTAIRPQRLNVCLHAHPTINKRILQSIRTATKGALFVCVGLHAVPPSHMQRTRKHGKRSALRYEDVDASTDTARSSRPALSQHCSLLFPKFMSHVCLDPPAHCPLLSTLRLTLGPCDEDPQRRPSTWMPTVRYGTAVCPTAKSIWPKRWSSQWRGWRRLRCVCGSWVHLYL